MKNVKTDKVVLTGVSRHCFLNKENKPIMLKKEFPEFDKKLRELAEENQM